MLQPSKRRHTTGKLAAAAVASFAVEQLEERRLMSYYYVSPSGNDAWNGMSTTKPFRTLAKLNTVNFKAGDTICLLSGATFAGKIYFDANDAGNVSTPITVQNWNAGKPTIASGTEFGIFAYNTGGVVIKDINVTGAGATNTSGGIFFYNDRTDGAKLDGITINNVEVQGYKYGLEIGGGVNAAGGANTAGFRNVTVSNSTFHDNIMAGVFTFGATYNVNEKLWIHHCKAYNNTGVAGYVGVSGQGFCLGNVNGATLERCEAYNNGAIGNGGAGIWAYDSTKVLLQFNESHHNRTGGPHDGDGFDLDQNTSSSVMQYNYSHDNDGSGYLMATKFNNTLHSGNIVRYNVSQNDGRKLDYGALHIWGKVLNSEWYNNTVFLSPNAAGTTPQAVKIINDTITANDVQHVHFRNNIFQTTGSVPMVKVTTDQINGSLDLKFENNDYFATGGTTKFLWGASTYTTLSGWRTASGQETRSGVSMGTTVDPKLAAPGTGGTIGDVDLIGTAGTLTAYQLQEGSPVINAGTDLFATFAIDPGSRDFWASGLPLNGAYDMGANESTFAAPVSPPPPPPPPPSTQSPFLGSAFAIGTSSATTIEAENFDLGGEGVAYHDVDGVNSGAQYRTGEGVDVETTAGGYDVGYIKAGEWLEYTVNATAGTYDFTARVAANSTGGALHVEVDGVNVSGLIAVPNTAGWQTWANTAAKRFNLTAGSHVVRVYFDTNGTSGYVGNLDSIKFTPVAAPVDPAPGTTTPITSTKSAYVQDGANAGVNFGSAGALQVKKNTTGYNRESYLSFDLTGVTTISGATLRLYGNLSDTSVASLTTSIYTAGTAAWDENTITYNTKPAAGSQVGSVTVSGTAGAWYEVDLTSFLQAAKAAGQTSITLVLKNTTTSNAVSTFQSDDSANAPQLVVLS